MIVEPKLVNAVITWAGLGLVGCALFGIMGTLYQKKFCQNVDMRSGQVIQLSAALVMMVPLAIFAEDAHIQWSGMFIFSLFWLSIIMSVGALSILGWLIRHGAITSVAIIFYLIPPVTTLYAHIIFGEQLGWLGIMGMILVMIGVGLSVRSRLSTDNRRKR